MKSAKRSAAAASRDSKPPRQRQQHKARTPAKSRTTAPRREKQAASPTPRRPWTASDTDDLETKLSGWLFDAGTTIPKARRQLLAKHVGQTINRLMQDGPAMADWDRVRDDLDKMRDACRLLRRLGRKKSNLRWILKACDRRLDMPFRILPHASRYSSLRSSGGLLCYERHESALVPTGHEEYLLDVGELLDHDLHRLSIALDKAAEMLKGKHPTKAEKHGAGFNMLLYEIYVEYRRDLGLGPSINGPFKQIAKLAVRRVFGEVLGGRVLADSLRDLNYLWQFHKPGRGESAKPAVTVSPVGAVPCGVDTIDPKKRR